jgi:hypothetical protein
MPGENYTKITLNLSHQTLFSSILGEADEATEVATHPMEAIASGITAF